VIGLRTRLAIAAAAIAGASVLAVGSIGYVSTAHALRSELDSSLRAFASRLTDSDRHSVEKLCESDRVGEGHDRDDLLLALPGASIECVAPDGSVRAWISSEPRPGDLTEQLGRPHGTGVGRPTTVSLGGHPYRFVVATAPDGSQVRVGRSLAEVDQALSSILVRTLAVGASVIAVAALLGIVIARWLTGPLELLTDAAERIARSGRTDIPIAVERKDETGRLAGALQTMLAALHESRDAQQQLVQDAGHELRTPLTSMRANVGTLLRHPDLEPGARREALASVDAELIELSTLVDELVELAIDAPDAEPRVEVSVDRLVEDAVDRARRRSSREFALSVAPFTVDAPARLLARAVGNLVDNAVKFSPDDTVIEVQVRPGRVTVRDHGPGFEDVDLPLVFDRFYRAVGARSLSGSGLGLAIVRRAAEESGATASAANAPGGGALLEIRWPDGGFSGTSMETLTSS
jgi:two-component system sensor histidine kinase MprB